jgi:hypothetical protein
LRITILLNHSRTSVKPSGLTVQLSFEQCQKRVIATTPEGRKKTDVLFSGATMSSVASIKKHPVHPMLVAFPIGLWVFALVCDVVRAAGGDAVWQTVAIYCIAGGIVGALLAAIPGLIDYFSIDEAAMRRSQICTWPSIWAPL